MIKLVMTGIVAFMHFGFMYLEMFLWEKPLGLKVFKLKKDFANESKVLASNQGLYNGFLASGLVWSFFINDPIWSTKVAIFFLSCVLVAGLYGAMTASKSILFVQALPAALTLLTYFIF
jgi:putative membrane protein